MKVVVTLLLMIIVVVWAHPDYSVSNGDGGRNVTQVQKERKADISQNNSTENQMVKHVRRKRGLGKLFRLIFDLIRRILSKTKPRVVPLVPRIVEKAGKAMEHIELGTTIVQAISGCPTSNICPLKEKVKAIEDSIDNALQTLHQIHSRLEECANSANRVRNKTELILSSIKTITESLTYISNVAELNYLEHMGFTCAKENNTTITECLLERIHNVEFVYSKMLDRLNDIKRDNMAHAVVSFVVQKTVSTIVGNIIKLSKKNYDYLVKQFGKPNSKLKKLKMITKAVLSVIPGTARKAFTSTRNVVLTPVRTLKHKLGRVSQRMRSFKHRVVYTLKHRRQGFKHLWNKLNPKKYSVRSVLGGFVKGSLTGIASSVSLYMKQRRYVELEDELRKTISKYESDLRNLTELIEEEKKSQASCVNYINSSIALFRGTVAEILQFFDDMISNTTQSKIKKALYHNISSVLLGIIDHDNIHLKQDQILRTLENDYFDMTEMKSWVQTENALFSVVRDGVHNGSTTVMRMCDQLQYVGLDTTGRDHWPLQDVLCNLALFHPTNKAFDYYNMDNMRAYCRSTQDTFPLNTILLDRKNTFVQETVRRYVERGEEEEENPSELSRVISRYLEFDSYMRTLGKFPNTREVLCIIADMFPEMSRYAFYDLENFRPRSNCSLLTTEKFEQLELDAIEKRREMEQYRLLLSPHFLNSYLNKVVRKGLEKKVSISSVFNDIRQHLAIAGLKRKRNWPVKEILCALGTIAPLDMYDYDYYPVDVIRTQCQSGTLLTSQLQDILLKRKENLLEFSIRRYVDKEEEDPEAIVKELAKLLISDSIMKYLDINLTEHEMICMVANLYPSKEEYGLYRLDQFRPMTVCKQMTEQGFQILKDERERRKIEALISMYCSNSSEPCFPMARQTSENRPKIQYFSDSGTWSCHTTRNVFVVLVLFGLHCII